MKQIDGVYFDAGGGHRSALQALQAVLDAQHRRWALRPLQLQDALLPIDILYRTTGIRIEELYNRILRSGWTLGAAQMLKGLQAAIRSAHPKLKDRLSQVWRERQPDLVLSLIPNFNRVLGESLQEALPGTPFVTLLTDLADFPPHFWMEPPRRNEPDYVLCGTERAAEQALALGHRPEHVLRTSGMLLHPRFYQPVQLDREQERTRLGLDPALPTGIVLFGGMGSPDMLEIAAALDRSPLMLQLILVCGKNRQLAGTLRSRPGRIPLHVEEFTTDIPQLMHLADFFIGKPGPGSISEAIALQLPCIVKRNAWTLPQERFNAGWLLQQGLGLVIRRNAEVVDAVRFLLSGNRLALYTARIAAHRNRAVFEVPDLLERILLASPQRQPSPVRRSA
jgi:1,2-diacylglycerol 3-beta-galactosyltransferase